MSLVLYSQCLWLQTTFGGRLGEYKYYDMDAVIAAALTAAGRE